MKRYRKISGHKAVIDDATGLPKKTIVTIQPTDTDHRLVFEDCENVVIRGALVDNWQSPGDVMKGKPYGIDIVGGCKSIQFENPVVTGSPNTGSKKSWRSSANNGIIVRDDNTDINFINPLVSGVHFGMDIRGDIGSVRGGCVSMVSADNLCGRGDGWLIDGLAMHTSLEIVDYDELHRDLIQLYHKAPRGGTAAFISDWIIRNCKLGIAPSGAKFEKPAQIFLLSDGIGKNIKFTDNEIITGHDLVAVMSASIGAEISRNKVYTYGACKPQIRVIEQRYGVKSEAIVVRDNPIRTIGELTVRDFVSDQKPEPVVITENNQIEFAEFVSKCRNKKAKAITQQDYIAAGKRLGVGALMIKAFFQVESIRQGYLPDGSLKALLERHWVDRLSRQRGVLQSIRKSAGLANCNPKPGGYRGGKAEYFRARSVCESGEPEALDIALSSMSFGAPQIMGFNHKLAGYDSARAMVEHMHLSEVNQLIAFCNFIEAKGLVPLLQKAEENLSSGKSSGKYLKQVAEIYNGKKHKQYDLKIARAYRVLAEAESEITIKPKLKSNTLQGAAIATTSNAGAGVASFALILEQLSSARKLAETTAEKAQAEIKALKEQAAEPNYIMWVLIGFIILSQLGTIISILARLRDRFTGKNP